MLSKIINLLVVGVVLYIIYFIVTLIVGSLELPVLISTLVGVVLLLVLIAKIM